MSRCTSNPFARGQSAGAGGTCRTFAVAVRRPLTAAVWLGVLASVAMAQSGPPTGDVPARLKAVEELKIQIQDATAATTADASGRVAPDREQLIDQAIELRRGLIPELPPGSAERLKLTYEQSAALLARLARDGADTSVLVGLADDERLASVKAAADEVASLLEPLPREKAPIRELLLRGRLGLVQARLDASSPLAKQASRRAALAFRDAERAVQGGLAQMQAGEQAEADGFRRAGMALAILFDGSKDAPKAALQLLADLPAQPHPTRLEVEAARLIARLAQATALPTRGSSAPLPKTPEERREAVMAAIEQFDAATGVRPPTTAPSAESASVPTAAVSPLERVLAIEAGAAALADAWRATEDPALLASACERIAGITQIETPGVDREGRVSLARRITSTLLDSASRSGPEFTPPSLPALARFVWAERIEAGDPAAAAPLFESVVETKDGGASLDKALIAEAMWRRARLPGTSDEDARQWLMRLAREHPDSSHGPAAAGLAVERAMASDDPAKPLSAEARETLELAVGRFAESEGAMRWRLLLARSYGESGDWKAALAQIDRVAATSPEGQRAADAAFAIAVHRLESLAKSMAEARAAGDESRVRTIANQDVLPLTRRARDLLVARVPPGDARLVRLQAEAAIAMVEAGDGDARALLEALLADAGKVPGGATRVRLALARARLAIADERERGFSDLKALAADLDGRGDRSEPFWHAWTLILETVATERGDADHAGSIKANISKLRTIDRTLGGEPWTTRIQRVLDGLEP